MLSFSLDVNPTNAIMCRQILADMDAVIARIAAGAAPVELPADSETKAVLAKLEKKPAPAKLEVEPEETDTDEQTDEEKAKLKAASQKALKAAEARAKKKAPKKAPAKKAAASIEVTDYEVLDLDALFALSKERGGAFIRTHSTGRQWMMDYFSAQDVNGFKEFDDAGHRAFLIAMDEALIEDGMADA